MTVWQLTEEEKKRYYSLEWRKLTQYPFNGRYMISENGDVKSCWQKTREGSLLDQGFHEGYYRIGMQLQGKTKYFKVHRLVALAWGMLSDIKEDIQIDHVDGNKLNNHYTNLQRATNAENVKKGYIQGAYKTKKATNNECSLRLK